MRWVGWQKGPRERWVGTFTPAMISGLYAWYDFADLSTITLGTPPDVSSVSDKSGNSRTVSQGTASLRPNSETRTINGLNVLDFDGTDDHLITNLNLTQAQPFTIFAVFATDIATPSVADDVVYGLDTSGPQFGPATTTDWFIWAGTAAIKGGTPDTNAHTSSAVFNGASSQLWVDGTSIVTGNPGTLGLSTGEIGIGRYEAGAADQSFNGVIGEVIAYAAALSTTNRQRVEGYLKQKWATP